MLEVNRYIAEQIKTEINSVVQAEHYFMVLLLLFAEFEVEQQLNLVELEQHLAKSEVAESEAVEPDMAESDVAESEVYYAMDLIGPEIEKLQY